VIVIILILVILNVLAVLGRGILLVLAKYPDVFSGGAPKGPYGR
jgi:hypothetical protein